MKVPRELGKAVKSALERLRYWERRRETREGLPVQVGDKVRYKDEPVIGIVTELRDGFDGRRDLVGRAGAMVSFRGRRAVPVFLWALQLAEQSSEEK